MLEQALNSLSPLDGRYRQITLPLRGWFSEAALMRYRLQVEISWLLALAACPDFVALNDFSAKAKQYLSDMIINFNDTDAARIKGIEQTTNHDVKAIEYFLKEKMAASTELNQAAEFVHFAKTSEDINNVAYALMVGGATTAVILPELQKLHQQLTTMATNYAGLAMLSRTHGQPATPTTLGKELANFAARLTLAQTEINAHLPMLAKLNGAVGNFNAHVIACPEVAWPELAKQVIESLGLRYQPLSTQIEPHDNLAATAHALCRCNNILLDLARDVWGYIALDYFKLQVKGGEVGSSTMPHKVNPIDFENAEGNLGLANATLEHLAAKLPISRWQRDLSDSTALRSLAHGFGYTLLAIKSLSKGLAKLVANEVQISDDLEAHWEVLGEALQTIMRLYGLPAPYERIKEATRGKGLTKEAYLSLVMELELPSMVKKRLLALTPSGYIGLAKELAVGAEWVL